MFGWLRRRPRKSPLNDIKDSPDVWRAGDIACRTTRGGWVGLMSHNPSDGPEHGDRIRVDAVYWHRGAQFLGFTRYGDGKFAACEFRKIEPRADERKRADEDFVALLNGAPAKERV